MYNIHVCVDLVGVLVRSSTLFQKVLRIYVLERKFFSTQNVTSERHPYCQSSAVLEIYFTCVWMKKCELLNKISVRWGNV